MQGKRNAGAADPPIGNAKEPHFLVLISENFMEACATLSRPGITTLPSNQSPVKMDIAPVASVTGPPPTSMPSGLQSICCPLFQCKIFGSFFSSVNEST